MHARPVPKLPVHGQDVQRAQAVRRAGRCGEITKGALQVTFWPEWHDNSRGHFRTTHLLGPYDSISIQSLAIYNNDNVHRCIKMSKLVQKFAK